MTIGTIVSIIGKEIVRITADRKTLYMRVPRSWAKDKGLKRGDCLVCTQGGAGRMIVRTMDEVINDGRRSEDGEGV